MEFKKEDDSETYSESTDNPPELTHRNADVLTDLSTMSYTTSNEIQPYPRETWMPPAGNFISNPLDTVQRKRHRTEDSADDNTLELILGQITTKLNSMSTNEDSKSMLIAAFLEVLGCSSTEGEFYLESTAWDIQTAVSVYLENNPNPMTSFVKPFYPTIPKKYVDRDIYIPDLPCDWQARVCGVDGTVYFMHIPTNTRQLQVPPGYADFPTEGMEGIAAGVGVGIGGGMLSSCHTIHDIHASAVTHVFGTDSEYLKSHGEMKEDGDNDVSVGHAAAQGNGDGDGDGNHTTPAAGNGDTSSSNTHMDDAYTSEHNRHYG
ncbi:hypothetical protein EON63_17725 [archaeon]|nr:MAG: hypothetical protein EON63_17725 [archaeon]